MRAANSPLVRSGRLAAGFCRRLPCLRQPCDQLAFERQSKNVPQGNGIEVRRACRPPELQPCLTVAVDHRRGDLVHVRPAEVLGPPRDSPPFQFLRARLLFGEGSTLQIILNEDFKRRAVASLGQLIVAALGAFTLQFGPGFLQVPGVQSEAAGGRCVRPPSPRATKRRTGPPAARGRELCACGCHKPE